MVLNQDRVELGEGLREDIAENLDILELSTSDGVSMLIKEHSLVGKVIADKFIKVGPLRTILSKAWLVKGKLEVYELERNIFLFVFEEANDKMKVVCQGPWSVMDCLIVLKDWPTEATLEEIDFSLSEIWVQVHNLPVVYLTKQNA
ncbi:hypothetical protein REPUB_Repub05bG0094200 [Reevesia pubescens]